MTVALFAASTCTFGRPSAAQHPSAVWKLTVTPQNAADRNVGDEPIGNLENRQSATQASLSPEPAQVVRPGQAAAPKAHGRLIARVSGKTQHENPSNPLAVENRRVQINNWTNQLPR